MWALRPTTAPPLMGEPKLDVGPTSNMGYKERGHVREGHYVCSSMIAHIISERKCVEKLREQEMEAMVSRTETGNASGLLL